MAKLAGQHAVVIGASMGGLTAARALADSYARVTVLERDAFPAQAAPRKGVPQGPHAHGLLARGREVLEQFFPGFTDEIAAKGALPLDPTSAARWFMEGAYHADYESGLTSLLVSRPLLEHHVRERLLALPNVTAIERCDVLGLATSADRSAVTGVRIIRRAEGGAEEVLSADLVVDASGRGSRTPAWLEELGYARPEEDRVEVGIVYVTREYRRTPDQLGKHLALISATTDERRHAAVLLAQEDDRWIVTFYGYKGEQPPTDEQALMAFASGLECQDIYRVISQSEPLSEPIAIKFPASQRRYYERLTRFPSGLLVIGDAICSFNPIYGQGMTSASLQALALHEMLAEGAHDLARRFFARASKVVDIPWSMAVGADLRYPEVQGKRTPLTRFLNWYIKHLHAAAHADPVVSLAFMQVTNLVAPPPTILRPQIALRVLRSALRRRSAQRPMPAPQPTV